MTDATANKPTNYTPAQEALILAAVAANGNVADKSVAETLAADERMNKDGTPRNVRSIIAKMTRMDVDYQRAVPTTKDGKPVTKKQDLVKSIADLSGITASKLGGLDNAPKLALEAIRDAFAATGTEG